MLLLAFYSVGTRIIRKKVLYFDGEPTEDEAQESAIKVYEKLGRLENIGDLEVDTTFKLRNRVYVSNHGKVYHLDKHCHQISKGSVSAVLLQSALNRRFPLCKTCTRDIQDFEG